MVPDFQTLMRPTLVSLTAGPSLSLQEIRSAVAEALQVSEEDQAVLLPSGQQTTYSNLIAWALSHMGKAGLVSRPARARYALTERGRQVLEENSDRVDMATLSAFPEYQEFRTPKPVLSTVAPAAVETEDSLATSEISPSESMGRLSRLADAALAEELLDQVLAQPPVFLERPALRLLSAMGYGGRESLAEHTGKPGDAGLDGIVREDSLGLDLVGVQAKRYDKTATVSRPEIQAFVGALQGAQTSRGVFVTTARFSPGARQFADGVTMRLVLIDRPELSRLMVRYNVGASVRKTFELKQVDKTFFEE